MRKEKKKPKECIKTKYWLMVGGENDHFRISDQSSDPYKYIEEYNNLVPATNVVLQIRIRSDLNHFTRFETSIMNLDTDPVVTCYRGKLDFLNNWNRLVRYGNGNIVAEVR